jgi:hypothetical protein
LGGGKGGGGSEPCVKLWRMVIRPGPVSPLRARAHPTQRGGHTSRICAVPLWLKHKLYRQMPCVCVFKPHWRAAAQRGCCARGAAGARAHKGLAAVVVQLLSDHELQAAGLMHCAGVFGTHTSHRSTLTHTHTLITPQTTREHMFVCVCVVVGLTATP